MRRIVLVMLVALSVAGLLWATRTSPPVEAPVDGANVQPPPKRANKPPRKRVLTGRVVRTILGRDVGVVGALISVACGEADRSAGSPAGTGPVAPGGPTEPSPTPEEEPAPDPRFRTVTRRDGTFSFTRLPMGLCTVSASAPGMVAGGPDPEARTRVQLRAGMPAEDVLLRLYATTQLTGVVKNRGAGVGGVQLSLLYQESPVSSEPFGVEVDAVTDPLGNFTIEGVGPGRLRVLAVHDELGTAESDDVEVVDSAIEGISVDLTAEGALAGVVRDARGKTLAGATVLLVVPGEEGERNLVTDGGGHFRVEDLPPGPVRVTTRALGFLDADPVDVTVLAERDVAVNVVMTPRPGFGGVVLGPDGEPVGGAQVFGHDENGFEVLASTSDELGRFWFDVPSEGDTGIVPVPVKELFARHQSFTPSKHIKVRGDERDLVLRLERGAQIVGTLLDGAGKPVTAFVVELIRIGGYSEGISGNTVDDPTGAFLLEGVEGGRYRAVLSRPDSIQRLETKAFAVTPGRITQLGTLRFEPLGVLTGTVVDENGRAVVGAAVQLVAGTSTNSDDAGRFRLEPAASGDTLRISASGFREKLISRVVVSEGRERSIGTVRLKADPDGLSTVEYTGIGTRVSPAEGGGVSLDQVFEGSPAAKAGIESGSVVVGIDGDDATTMSLERAIELMRGPAGTSVMLDIVGPGGGAPRKVKLVRSDVVSQ